MRKPSNTENAGMRSILAEVLKTVELRAMFKDLASDVLRSWAGEKAIKRKIADFLNREVEKAIDSQAPDATEFRIDALLGNAEFLALANYQLPILIKGLADWIPAYLKQLESQPPDVQTKFVKDILDGALSDQAGEAFSSVVNIIKSSRDSNEEPLSVRVLSFLSNWLQGADFGEFKELLDLSREGMEKVVQGANDLIWRYPAKLIILMSLIPFALNLGLKGLREIIGGFNQAPPDLAADIIASLLKEIDSDAALDLMNETFEIVRKIATGSALIGEPGNPRITDDIASLLNKIADGMDEDVSYKSKLALFREKEEINKQVRSSLYENSDRLDRKIGFETAKINIKLQSLTHKLALADNLSDDEFESAVKSFFSDFDARELSELTDQVSRLLERIVQSQPDLFPQLIEQSTQQLDLFQLRDLMSSISENSADGLKQLGRAVAPKLITGVCHCLSPLDDEFEEDAREARNALKALFMEELS